jgi:hypothetical protein
MDGTSDGYPAYLVAQAATGHQATGLVIYAVAWFTQAFHADRAIAAPVTPAVRFRSLSTGVIIGLGGVRHIINNTGAPVDATAPNNLFGLEALAASPPSPESATGSHHARAARRGPAKASGTCPRPQAGSRPGPWAHRRLLRR